MKMLNRKTKFLTLAGILLVLASLAVFATDANIAWNPGRFSSASVAPNESFNTIITFTNRGLSNINGKELSLEVRGAAVGIVSVTAPSFPENIKKGESVPVNISIHAPSDQTVRVVTGTLVLLKMKSDGKTKEVFGDALPIEITLSPFPLPPNPGEAGKATIEGIDSDGNGVRDDIDRYIGFTYPNSEKVREALKQEARALTPFLFDAGDKELTRGNGLEMEKGLYCTYHIARSVEASMAIRTPFFVQFMNTKERSRAYWKANQQLGGTVTSDEIAELKQNEYNTLCTFNPDLLPN
jgi:hypothetical protein